MKLYVVFTVAGVDYALPVELVLQMETFTGATPVPGTADYVAGVVTVRGRVVPVVDVRRRFGLPSAEINADSRIIVTLFDSRVVALRVDSAREVLKLDPANEQPAPPVVIERSAGFVRAVQYVGQSGRSPAAAQELGQSGRSPAAAQEQHQRLLLLIDISKVLGDINHDDKPRASLDDGAFQRRPALPG